MIMEDQHMTQQVFADFLQLAPATLSSIFNGRTRPTLNIVEAIKSKIPDISIEWLLFGIGEMHVSHSNATESPLEDVSNNGVEQMLNFEPPTTGSYQQVVQVPPYQGMNSPVRGGRMELVRNDVRIEEKEPRKVTEIRVYYDDQTYETFVPAKK